ncbi:MAG TPA: hypothetical protein VGR98_28095 [Streptosporangiaceae bacterium]|nr:hypothetical protein [Streptosporangiaceae bacterium]
MPVKEADPAAVSLDAAFAQAMGAPPKPKGPAAPPEVDHEAPHGRDEDGKPLEPYGRNKDGSIRKSAAGRKSKDDAARTAPAAQAAAKHAVAAVPEPVNYVPGLTETADGAWMVLSVTAKVGPELPLVGRLIPGRKIAAQATVFRQNAPSLVGALQYASQHNAAAARWAERLTRAEVTWTLMFGLMVMPFAIQSAALWKLKDGEALGGDAGGPTLADLEQRNSDDLDQFMALMAAQLGAASAQAQTAAEMVTAEGQAEGGVNGSVPQA